MATRFVTNRGVLTWNPDKVKWEGPRSLTDLVDATPVLPRQAWPVSIPFDPDPADPRWQTLQVAEALRTAEIGYECVDPPDGLIPDLPPGGVA